MPQRSGLNTLAREARDDVPLSSYAKHIDKLLADLANYTDDTPLGGIARTEADRSERANTSPVPEIVEYDRHKLAATDT